MTSGICELFVMLIFVAGDGICDEEKEEKRPNLDSRFFDIGGVINQLFPGLGQAVQGPYGVSGGAAYPANNQFYPGMNVQGPSNQRPMDSWPIIDDASRYPSQGNFGNPQQTVMPPQNGLNPKQTQYPNQGGMSYPQQVQYPSQGNVNNPQKRPYTNPGNGGQYPNQGDFNQFPSQPSYPNQVFDPQYPGGGNFGTPTQYPSQGNPQENQFANDKGPGKRPGNDGTLYSVLPPDQLDNDDDPNDSQTGNGRNPTAILGRPVVVPPMNTPDGQIFFPNSTESPAKRQCVQDCQSTSEYNPVCGSNSVTYFNPGKFVCARNCGVAAQLQNTSLAKSFIELFMKLGADINQGDGCSGYTILHHTIWSRKYELAKWLTQCQGIDLNFKTYGKLTAYQLAYKNNDHKMMQILARHGACCEEPESSESSCYSDSSDDE